MAREFFSLECTQCKRRNYRTPRQTRGGTKLELKKFCKHKDCRTHTLHKEKKK
ncbi:MAG: 50S ribosomal protein L33 [Planctomycetota bacterium]|nr:50S ribosomal protein L33 [Planctomycetota bacterium]